MFWIAWSMVLVGMAPVAWYEIGLGPFGGDWGGFVKDVPLKLALLLMALSALGYETYRLVKRGHLVASAPGKWLARVALYLFWGCLAGTWAFFWLLDLRRAHFQVVLLAIPASALLLAAVRWRAKTMPNPTYLWIATTLLIALTPSATIAVLDGRPDLPVLQAEILCAFGWLVLFLRQLRGHRPPWGPVRTFKFWRGALGAGGVVGIAIIWPIALARTNNGCTGVSAIYDTTIVVTLFVLYSLGPVVLSRYLQSA